MRERLFKAVIICTMIFVLLVPSTMRASAKTVTKTEKKAIDKVISTFDTFLAMDAANHKDTKFLFNDYTRTIMLCTTDSGYYGKTFKQLKKQYKGKWKKYFTAPVNIKMHKSNTYSIPYGADVSHYIQLVNGEIQQVAGDLGDYCPKGCLSNLRKEGSKKYIATYKIMLYGPDYGSGDMKKLGIMGIYRFTLKRSGDKFRISDIKCKKAIGRWL